MSEEEQDCLLRDVGIVLGLVRGRVEKNTYKFSGRLDDPEWNGFKRDVAKDKADGLSS